MKRILGIEDYRQISEYDELIDVLIEFSRPLLLSFKKNPLSIRDTIIRNFIARSSVTLSSVKHVWHLGHHSDGWSLMRIMIDRLFHLHVLAEDDKFEDFEEWSFIREYEASNRAASDPSMSIRSLRKLVKPSSPQKKRYRTLKKNPPDWKPITPKDAAKSLGLPFLYSYGYDFASTKIHPMATDGYKEASLLLGNVATDELKNPIVLHNSILVSTLILQEGLNASSMKWRAIVYDFIDQARGALTGKQGYKSTYNKLVFAGPDFEWFRQ